MDNGLLYVTGVSHIGIAVPDIVEAEKEYRMLGFQPGSGDIISEPDYGVRTKMMQLGGQVIELLEPFKKGEPSPIDNYIKTNPYKMYHLAYVVSNLEGQIELLEKKKYVMIDEPKVSKAMDGKRAVFMFHRKVGIIELVEE